MIKAFYHDINLKLTEKIYIVELGSGSGSFSYKLLNLLFNDDDFDNKITYIITDYSKKNLDFIEQHFQMKKFIKKGLLDFSFFDVNSSKELNLFYSKKKINIDHKIENIIIISNYVFDSIPQDVFKFKNGKIYEGMVTLSSKKEFKSNIDDLDITFDYSLINKEYYQDKKYNDILDFYCKNLSNSVVLIPINSFLVIDLLKSFSEENFLLITTDKGVVEKHFLENIPGIKLTKHGSFSLYVNFHSFVLLNSFNSGLNLFQNSNKEINTLVFISSKSHISFNSITKKYSEISLGFNSSDYYFILKKTLKENKVLSLNEFLSILKIGCYDPELFYFFYNSYFNSNQPLIDKYKNKINSSILETERNYYVYDDNDLYYIFSKILFELKFFKSSLKFINKSIRIFGGKSNNHYLRSLIYLALNHKKKAFQDIEQTLNFDPNYTYAINLKKLFNLSR